MNSRAGYVTKNFTTDKVIVIVDIDDENHFIQSKSAISWSIRFYELLLKKFN